MSFHSRPRPTGSAAADIFDVAVEPDFDFASEEYQSIERRAQTTAFQASQWLHFLHSDIVSARGAQAVTVTVREKMARRLVLVLPLVRLHRKGLSFLEFADFGLCDYLGAVYDRGDTERLTGNAALPARVAAVLPPSDIVSFTKLATNDPVLRRLFPNASRAQMRVSAHAMRVGTDWNEWRLERFERSLRNELDVKRRRLNKAGSASFVLVKDDGEIVRVFDALRSFRAQRFKERGSDDVIDNEAVFAFYRRMAVEGARAGTARTFCLYLSGEPAAVMFGLVHRQTFSLLLVGFDLARYRRLSVGLLAIEDTLRASVAAGDAIYDFTIGDYPFKLQFGAEPKPLYEWHLARTVRGRLAIFGIAVEREAKRVLKPLVLRARRLPWIATMTGLLKGRRQ